MKHSTRFNLGCLVTTLAASLAHARTPLGGVERDCTSGPPIPEVWPGAAVKWTYVYTPHRGQDWLAPGWPLTCTDSGGHTPGLSTLIASADAFGQAAMPGGGPRVSSFGLSLDPTAAIPSPTPSGSQRWQSFLANDGRNVVTFLEPMETFGDPTILALTAVSLNAAGAIVDADIAFQALSTRRTFWGQYNLFSGIRAIFSFVDQSPQGILYHTDAMRHFNPASGGPPAEAYVDLAGTFMHELGHLAGLEHSLLDSRAGNWGSLFPTMFWRSQSEPFVGVQLSNYPAATTPTCTPDSYAVGYEGTRVVGILSRSARTLELDDLHALATAYPRPSGDAFYQQTGTITGSLDPLPGPGVASIVAFNAQNPDALRVTTLTDDLGNFTLRALPPGQYLVFVENIDLDYFGAAFFALPTFIDSFGCNRAALAVMPEFYDANESATEASHMVASQVDVVAGRTSPLEIVPNASTTDRLLWAGRVGVGPTIFFGYSLRGLLMPTPYVPGIEPERVVLEVRGLTPRTQVTFFVDVSRIAFPFGGQLLQVLPLVLGTAEAGLPTGYGSTPADTARLFITLPFWFSRTNLFVQSTYLNQASEVVLTNPVNLWYGRQIF